MKKTIAFIIAVLFVFSVAFISIAAEEKAAETTKKETASGKTKIKAVGDVKAVDAAANSITITRKKGDLTFSTDKDTVVKIDKKKITLADVKVGDKVTIMYQKKDNKEVATSITVSTKKAAGTTKKEESKKEEPKKAAGY